MTNECGRIFAGELDRAKPVLACGELPYRLLWTRREGA
jgi:hypothetical protein